MATLSRCALPWALALGLLLAPSLPTTAPVQAESKVQREVKELKKVKHELKEIHKKEKKTHSKKAKAKLKHKEKKLKQEEKKLKRALHHAKKK